MIDREEAVKRYVKACQQFDKENALSACNLNSVVSLWNGAQLESATDSEILAEYRDIPESVIRSIKGLLAHNWALSEILFSGAGETTKSLEEYQQGKKKFWDDLKAIMEKF